MQQWLNGTILNAPQQQTMSKEMSCPIQLNSNLSEEELKQHELDLHTIPAKRLDTASIAIVATLQEAYETMQSQQCEVLYIKGAHGVAKKHIYGVITRKHIESSYKI